MHNCTVGANIIRPYKSYQILGLVGIESLSIDNLTNKNRAYHVASPVLKGGIIAVCRFCDSYHSFRQLYQMHQQLRQRFWRCWQQ